MEWGKKLLDQLGKWTRFLVSRTEECFGRASSSYGAAV
jgi:hypothetical protein